MTQVCAQTENFNVNDNLYSLNCKCRFDLSSIRHYTTNTNGYTDHNSLQILRLKFHTNVANIITFLTLHTYSATLDRLQLAYASYFIAEYYLDGKRYNEARRYIQKAICKFFEINGRIEQSSSVALQNGDCSPKDIIVYKTIIARNGGLWCTIVKSFWLAARIEQSEQRYDKAAELLNSAMDVATKCEGAKIMTYKQSCLEAVNLNQSCLQLCEPSPATVMLDGDHDSAIMQQTETREESCNTGDISIVADTIPTQSATIAAHIDNSVEIKDSSNEATNNMEGESVVIEEEMCDGDHDTTHIQISLPVSHTQQLKKEFSYQLITNNLSKKFSCDICGRKYKSQASLNTHARVHTDAAVVCDICGMKFPYHSNLLQHKRTHENVRSYQCDICGKAFSEKGNYKRHARLHSGERPYKCLHCNRRFTDSSARVDHTRRKHTNERPYKCGQCNATFVSFSDVKSHSLVHTDERPHQCQSCLKRFKRKSDFVKHSQTCKT